MSDTNKPQPEVAIELGAELDDIGAQIHHQFFRVCTECDHPGFSITEVEACVRVLLRRAYDIAKTPK